MVSHTPVWRVGLVVGCRRVTNTGRYIFRLFLLQEGTVPGDIVEIVLADHTWDFLRSPPVQQTDNDIPVGTRVALPSYFDSEKEAFAFSKFKKNRAYYEAILVQKKPLKNTTDDASAYTEYIFAYSSHGTPRFFSSICKKEDSQWQVLRETQTDVDGLPVLSW